MKKKDKTVILQRIGNVLTIAAVIFLIRYVCRLQIDWSLFISGRLLLPVILCLIVYILAITFLGSAWCMILECTSSMKVRFRMGVPVYLKANMGKYIPGNVFHYVERNLFAARIGIGQAQVAISSVIEIIGQLLSALLLSLLFLRGRISSAITFISSKCTSIVLLIVAAVILIIAVIGIIFSKRANIEGILMTMKNVHNRPLYLLTFCIYILTHLLLSASVALLVYSVIDNHMGYNGGQVMGAYIAGWTAGFVVPGAPGGIGVRELVITMLLSGTPYEKSIVPAVLIHRFVSVVGDLIAYVISVLYMRLKFDKEEK